MRVLIAYATKYGATKEIAERIGEILKQEGLAVEIAPAKDVTSLCTYDCIILGSGIYSADWLPEAVELFESFQEDLVNKAVWLFSDGPTVDDDPSDVLGGWKYPEHLQPSIELVNPNDIALFAGKIDANKLSMEDWLLNRSMRGVVGDFRNWGVIESWAKGIARNLKNNKACLAT